MNENLNEKVSVNINPATLSQIDLLVIENVPGTDGYSMDEPAPGIYHIRAGLFEHSNSRVRGNIELGDRIYSLIRCRGMLRN